MKTVLIVDGYNAINAIDDVKKKLKESLLSARSEIILLTKEYARSSGYITDFHVVFDGQDRYRHMDRLKVPRDGKHTFSRTGDGDEKIIETIKQYAEKNRVVVASNDNYVRNNARSYGASLINSEDLCGKKKELLKEKQEKSLDKRTKDQITKEYMEELGL